MSNRVVIFGVESVFTPETLETVRRCGMEVAATILVGEPEWDMQGLDIILLADIPSKLLASDFVVPWVTPGYRQTRVREAKDAGFSNFRTLVDPTSSIAMSAQLGTGAYINSGVAIGALAQIGDGVLINRNASVGHHSNLAPYVSLGPGATVAARCTIGKGVMVGAGAVVAPGISIGENSVVAVGAVVARDVPPHTVVAGNPARSVRSDVAGYRDLEVQ